jgi:flagellar protein FlgJ
MTTGTIPSIFDVNNLTALKGAVKQDDPKALKAAAQQFEALFLQMVLKSMRDASPRDGLFDSEQTRMYESLLDQQLAHVMSAKGGTGLAALIEKQLAKTQAEPVAFENGVPLAPPPKQVPLDAKAVPPLDRTLPDPGAAPAAAAPESAAGDGQASPAMREFVGRIWPHAVETSRATGIPAHFLVAQAALETGWGRAEPRLADGRPSYNLFGVKSGPSWTGPVAEASTIEYVDGLAQRQTARFRAYGSYAESFRDYAAMLQSNPRYAGIGGGQDAVAFARGLQRAGYATDPAYADKLARIIGGNTLRNALAG